MAKKISTLEDFVRDYVQNVKIGSSTAGYSDWLKEHGVDAEKIYSSKIASVEGNYLKTSPSYGKVAEKLSGIGLLNSGYYDYLNKKASGDYKKSRDAIETEYIKNRSENINGYADYVEKTLNESELSQKNKIDSVISTLRAMGSINFEVAYDYALSQGLSEAEAENAATHAIERSRKSAKQQVATAIVNKRLTREQAKNYSLAMGLGQKDSEELSEFAYLINEHSGYKDSDSVLEDLKDKLGIK